MNVALEEAWNGVAWKLRGYVRSHVRDHASAEDLLQDIFLKAHKIRAGVSKVKNMEGWLFFIARNTVIDHFRKKKPTEEIPPDLMANCGERFGLVAPVGCSVPLSMRFSQRLQLLPERGAA